MKKGFFDINRYDRIDHRPIDRGAEDGKILKLSQAWERGLASSSTDEEKRRFKELLFAGYTANDATILWEGISKKTVKEGGLLIDNPAFMAYTLRFGECSEAFNWWLYYAPSAMNLLASFGLDVFGNEMKLDDPFRARVEEDPIHASVRFRSHLALELVQRMMDASSGPLRVFDAGAGCLQWCRIGIERGVDLPVEVIACDRDPRAKEWYDKYPPFDRIRGRVDYRLSDFVSVAKSLPPESQDVILMLGVASYCVDALPQIIRLLDRILKKGGVILMDLQVSDPSMKRSQEIFWHSEVFSPSTSVDDATWTVKGALHGLSSYSEMLYYTDPRLDDPIGVVFELPKAV